MASIHIAQHIQVLFLRGLIRLGLFSPYLSDLPQINKVGGSLIAFGCFLVEKVELI